MALAAVVVLMSLVATANAVLLTHAASYGPIAVGSAAGVGASLPKFDPSLGTLTMVTLTLDSNTFAGAIGWDNEVDAASDVTLGIRAKVTINAFDTLAVSAMPLQASSSSVTADNDGTPDYAGTDAFWVVGCLGSDSNSNNSTDVTIRALFTGAGETFSVWLSSSLSTSVSTTGGWGPSIILAGQTNGTITVTYEYTHLPEPATVALLGLSSVVLGSKRRL